MPSGFEGHERLACYISEEEDTPKPQDTDEVLFEWLQTNACCRVQTEKARANTRLAIQSQQSGVGGFSRKRIAAPPDFESLLTPRYQKILLDYQDTSDKNYQASPRARACQQPRAFPSLRGTLTAREPPRCRIWQRRGKNKATLRIQRRMMTNRSH